MSCLLCLEDSLQPVIKTEPPHSEVKRSVFIYDSKETNTGPCHQSYECPLSLWAPRQNKRIGKSRPHPSLLTLACLVADFYFCLIVFVNCLNNSSYLSHREKTIKTWWEIQNLESRPDLMNQNLDILWSPEMCICIKIKKSCLMSVRHNTKLKCMEMESFSWEITSKVFQARDSNY